MNIDEMLVRSHPGDGLVGRFAGVVIVAVPASPRQEAVADQLLSLAEAGAVTGPTPGRRLARQVAGLLGAADPDDVPAFCLLAQADSGVVLILQGSMDADVSGPQGKEHLSGSLVATWIDRILPPPLDSIVVSPTGGASAAPNPRSRLGAGVVSGAGVTVLAAGASAPAPAPAAASPAPAPA